MLVPKLSELALAKLSAPQLDRDRQFIEVIRKEVVTPLLAELEDAVPGYSSLSDIDKYLALLRLNEEHAPDGERFLVDFGHLPMVDERTSDVYYTDTVCAFFSGKKMYQNDCLTTTVRNEAKRYIPIFIQGNSGLPLSSFINGNLWLNFSSEEFLNNYYVKLPPCFKVALVAELVRQNVVASRAAACRFAAGFDDSIHATGIDASLLVDSRGQRYGWTVTFRATKPSNDAVIELASWMRNVVDESIKMNSLASSIPDFDGSYAPLFAVDTPARGPREGTLDLIWFIDDYLPSNDRRVGRGGNISWTDAFLMFDEMFPDRYHGVYSDDLPGAVQNFRNAYYNAKRRHAKKSQEGGNDGA